MNSCPKRRKGYALGGLVAVLLGMGRAEAVISGGGELFGEGTVERVAQNSGSPEADRLWQEGWQLYREGTAESLRGATEKWEEALRLYREARIQDREAITLARIGLVYSALGEKRKALDYYHQALPLFQEVGDRSSEASTLANIGSAYSFLGENEKALEYYEQALPILQEVGDRSDEAATLNLMGEVYSERGENQKALDYYERSLTLSQAVGDLTREASTLTGIGSVYSQWGEKEKALDYYDRALSLHQSVGNRAGEANTLNSMGFVYFDLGERQKALDYNNQALLIFQAIGHRAGEAAALQNIGKIYFDWGEQQKALDYYNQALVMNQAIGNLSGQAFTLTSIGAVYTFLGQKQKALNYHEQALLIYQKVGNRRNEAYTLSNIAAVYSDLGDNQKALTYHERALPLFQAVGNRAGEALSLNGIGEFHSKLGEKQKALDYYKQALSIYQEVGDLYGEAYTLSNIGKVYSDLGEQDQALDYYTRALPLRQAVGDRSGEALTLSQLALLYRRQNNFTEALTHINTAIDLIEQLRSKIASDDLRMSYFASVQGYYQFQLNLLMQLHQQHPERGYDTQAFNTSERSRARVLLELLYESNLDIRQGVSPDLLEDEDTLLQTLKNIETRRIATLSRERGNTQEETDALKAEITALDKETDDTLAQLDLLKVQLKADNPAYAALQYPEPLTLSQVQQQVLDKDSLLLQYAIGEDRSYLWAVTPTEMTVHTLPGAAELAEAIEPFYSTLETSGNTEDAIAETAKNLSDIILAPVADKLPGKRLIVVADGELHAIPFAALSEPGKADYTPLIAQHEIVNLPSASAIAISRQQVAGRTPAPKTLAVLADPVYTSDDPRLGTGSAPSEVPIEIQRNLREFDLRSVARLPYTRQEADTLLALVPANQRTAVFDFDADYNWATQAQLNQYRYIHFATHGFANPSQPELSGILLSLVNPQGSKRDNGILRLHDIFNLDLPAELVVLSACQTGLGTDTNGEGLVGLTRGLMYAGTPRVLVSLWNVNDEKTSILMSKFYRGILEGGLTPAAALRQAQIQMWQEYQDPNLWAAFVLQGEWK